MKKMKILCSTLVIIFALSACSSGAGRSSSESNLAPSASGSNSNQDGFDSSVNLGNTSPSGQTLEKPSYEVNGDFSAEEYLLINENEETAISENSLLTFSLKVDTASYRNIVRYIESGNLPPIDAVKTEEMINYFNYDIKLEENESPFSIYTEIGPSPFDSNKFLAFIRVKSKEIDSEELVRSNLTFLLDTSGSMDSYDKLPLLKSAFELLVETLTEDDIVSIVTYAGNAAIVLDSVRGDQKERIINAINTLDAQGSTAGGDGIITAYKLAEKNFISNGNNRVILATDGDFNVGVSSVGQLENLMREKRGNGIYMTVLGFGTENLKDNNMETIAKNGNGNYSYIDSIVSAKKTLVDERSANLFTIADDVKAQVEFNPNLVNSYRLIGYENRMLENRDFEDDTKDAGEIGIGTDVVLMFEISLNSGMRGQSLKYQSTDIEPVDMDNEFADELFEIRIRYKNPGDSESRLITEPVKIDRILNKNTSDFSFASSVASFGHLLRNSQYSGNINIEIILEVVQDSLGNDQGGYRKEFLDILRKYRKITD